ncbi:unnamed protein product [Trifolium pratense]|uniref:Uncharacterized protein n=1 Tax=Trifolium pratense TaxID=57577 RepID=A0ACB0LU92_TRIPR|nr:unnamed protein product [Trifolium pratense]
MENEHEKNPSVLLDSEFKASTSKDLPCEQKHSDDDTSAEAQDESESFSDIDDEEVERYLCNEQEKHYRRLMWEREYQDFHEEMMEKLHQT